MELNFLAKVTLREGDTIDEALKRFSKQVRNNGVLNVLRKKEYYLKPGVKRKLKQKEARQKRSKKF